MDGSAPLHTSDVPWAAGFQAIMIHYVNKTGGSARYWAAHKLRGTLPRLLGKRGNTLGVARHNRPTLQRYSAKRVVGQLG